MRTHFKAKGDMMATGEAQYQQILTILSDIKREIAMLKSDLKWFFGSLVVLASLVLAALKIFQ